MTRTPPSRDTYRHGDLRHALVEAGVALARGGGASTVTIREATRQVGVSPSAAYRHFADLSEFLTAVQVEALAALSGHMQTALDKVPATGLASRDALDRATALGHSYVEFAINEPGLFAIAFIGAVRAAQSLGPVPPTEPGVAILSPVSGIEVVTPFRLLFTVLSELLATGDKAEDDVRAACLIAWSHVHGIAQLLIGPLADLGPAGRSQMVTSGIRATLIGLTSPPRVACGLAVPAS